MQLANNIDTEEVSSAIEEDTSWIFYDKFSSIDEEIATRYL